METLWVFKKKISRLQSKPSLHPAFHVYPWRNPSSTNISWSQTSEKYKNPHTKPVGDAHLKSSLYFEVKAPRLPLCVCLPLHRSAAVPHALSLSQSITGWPALPHAAVIYDQWAPGSSLRHTPACTIFVETPAGVISSAQFTKCTRHNLKQIFKHKSLFFKKVILKCCWFAKRNIFFRQSPISVK